jgi:uncharacterized membrane protein YgcG
VAVAGTPTVPPPGQDPVKHLEFIEAVIARQANNSFLIKGWSLTVAVAFFGFAIERSSWGLALLGLVPVAAFWFLDTYFLRQERLFRCLYDAVRSSSSVAPFAMDTRPYRKEPSTRWLRTAFSVTLRTFYGTLAVAGAIVLGVSAQDDGGSKAPMHSRTKCARSSFTVSDGHGSGGGQMSPTRSSNQRGTRCTWR